MDKDYIASEPLVGTKEIIAYLNITKETLHRWIKAGSIPCYRVGKFWKFRMSEIEAWVESGKSGNRD